MKKRFDYYLAYLLGLPLIRRLVCDAFHILSYGAPGVPQYWATDITWMGVHVLKNPMDLWFYQQIIHAVQPDLIIETGTSRGGSALYLACLCELLGRGQVITVDNHPFENRPGHERITYLCGSSTSESIVQQVRERVEGKESVMVILDSNHTKDHVLQEMNRYHSFVTPGSYLIVEDTNINGHPVYTAFGPGPGEAVKQFLRENQDFGIDPIYKKAYFSFNPSGYLRKKTDTP